MVDELTPAEARVRLVAAEKAVKAAGESAQQAKKTRKEVARLIRSSGLHSTALTVALGLLERP